MALSILAVDAAASSLLACVCTALTRLPTEVPGLAGCPCRTCVVPGLVAADGCDTRCGQLEPGQFPGQLTVSVIRLYSSDRAQFPREVQTVRDVRECEPPQTTAVELLITLFRCIPGMNNDGCPPTCEQLSASAMQLHADMLAIQQAVLCCYAATDTSRPRGRRYVLGQSRPIGPSGDCVGIEQRVTVALDYGLCCPAEALA